MYESLGAIAFSPPPTLQTYFGAPALVTAVRTPTGGTTTVTAPKIPTVKLPPPTPILRLPTIAPKPVVAVPTPSVFVPQPLSTPATPGTVFSSGGGGMVTGDVVATENADMASSLGFGVMPSQSTLIFLGLAAVVMFMESRKKGR